MRNRFWLSAAALLLGLASHAAASEDFCFDRHDYCNEDSALAEDACWDRCDARFPSQARYDASWERCTDRCVERAVRAHAACDVEIDRCLAAAERQPHGPRGGGDGLQHVGIPSEQMNFFAADQRQSQWCWAASIQMVLNYYGVSISQEQIVARTYGSDPYGRLPNWAGSFDAITANLNNWGLDNRGIHYAVAAAVYPGAPNPAALIRELAEGRPVIVGYRSGPNSGHAVVITAASYVMTRYGPSIQSVVARDPWPSSENIRTLGRVEYPGADFASLMQAHWYVRVR